MSNYNFLGSFLGKKAQLKKDGHDMSNKECMSLPFGVTVPVAYRAAVPNEHYKCSFKGAVQTSPMREDNFSTIYSKQKAVFVPMSSLCRNYLEMTQNERATRKDMLLQFPVKPFYVPFTPICTVVFMYYFKSMIAQAFVSFVPDYVEFTYSVEQGDFVFIDAKGDTILLEDRFSFDYKTASNFWMNHQTSQEYQAALFAYLCFDNVSNGQSQWTTLAEFVDAVRSDISPSGCPIYMDFMRLMDNLGILNLSPLFDSIYYNIFSTLTETTFPEFEVSHSSHALILQGKDSASVLGFVSLVWDSFNTFFGSERFSPTVLFAYQYYVQLCERSNYRNPDTSVLTLDSLYPLIYNGLNEFSVSSNIDSYILFGFDMFQTVSFCSSFQNSYQSVVSYVYEMSETDNIDDRSLFIYLFSLSNPLLPSDLFTSAPLSVVSGNIPDTDLDDIEANFVKAYAETSALYSLRQDLLRAGVKRDKQMQAIFGVSGNQHVYEKIKILDESSSIVHVDGLVNLAESENAPLGVRAARGNGEFGLNFSLDTEDFGFIFITQSYICDIYYEQFGTDKVHQLSPDSWFNPKFNHLGLEPIYGNYCSKYKYSSYTDQIVSPNENKVIGFSSRNFELKQVNNKVHGLFSNFGFLVPSPSFSEKRMSYLPSELMRGNGTFGGYVPTVIDQQVDLFDHRVSLYYSPYMMNNIFVQMVDGGIFGSYQFDQFREGFRFDCYKVSPMPKIGLFKLSI